MKKTTQAATFLGHVEVATTINEVGATYPSTPPTNGVVQPPKRQYIGDKVSIDFINYYVSVEKM